LAVLDILLGGAARGIQLDTHDLPAIRAGHLGLGLNLAIGERLVLVALFGLIKPGIIVSGTVHT
jgi:hypothetical protein